MNETTASILVSIGSAIPAIIIFFLISKILDNTTKISTDICYGLGLIIGVIIFGLGVCPMLLANSKGVIIEREMVREYRDKGVITTSDLIANTELKGAVLVKDNFKDCNNDNIHKIAVTIRTWDIPIYDHTVEIDKRDYK